MVGGGSGWEGAVIIDWVDNQAEAWGWQWRRMLEAETAGARSWWPKLIERDVLDTGRGFEFLLGDALVFHCAFKHIEFRHRELLANHYIDPSPVKAKCAAFKIAQRTWWQRLHTAHISISGLIDEHRAAQCAYARLEPYRA